MDIPMAALIVADVAAFAGLVAWVEWKRKTSRR
jgi:hypothetical protein